MSHNNAIIEHPIAFCAREIRRHLEILHDRASGINGKFVVSVFNEGLPGTITHHRVGEIDGMCASIIAHGRTLGANVYVGLHLMRHDLPRGKRGGESDIVAVLGLVADMDADTGKIGLMPINPSYVMETSPGNSQAAVLFERPIEPLNAKHFAKALQKATGADFGTGDIAHVWRVPGTLNWPNSAKIARGRSANSFAVTMTQPFEGVVYNNCDLTTALADFLSETRSREDNATFTSYSDTEPLWDRLTDIGRVLLKANGLPDRSVHAAKVVEQLGFEGYSLDEAVSLCHKHGGSWIEKYDGDQAKLTRDIERCWNKFVTSKDEERRANEAAAEEFLRNQKTEPPVNRLILPKSLAHDESPFSLERPGGLLTHVARFVYETSPSPLADFAIMSAVALHAGLFGRRWLTPEGLGLNLYIALVAGSGFGKDRPLKAMAQLAESIEHSHIIGPNDVASDSALEFILRQNPCQVLPLDELGMLLSASGKSSDAYARARRKAMLELYSHSTSSWVAKVRASDFQKGEKPKLKINWPTLSFLGATTPSTFYEGLEDDAFSSGFIARLIVVTVEQPPARQRIAGYPEVPQQLIGLLSEAVNFEATTPSFARVIASDSSIKPNYSAAVWADDATAFRLDQIRDWARELGVEDARRGQIVNRAGDNTSKLATIRAISRCPRAPVVTTDDIEWGFGIVLRSIQTVEDGANRYMFGSPFEALCKAILEAVRQCNDEKGLKNAELLRKPGVRQADERMIGDAINRLVSGTGELLNVGGALGRAGRGGRYLLPTVH